MDLTALIVFAGALAVAAGSPGPSIAALCAQVLNRGWRSVMPFLSAMWIGEGLWLSCAVFGLALIAETFFWGFVIIKWLGVAYLIFLAWQMWTSPLKGDPNHSVPTGNPWRMFFAGLAVTLGNPKIMVFYLALLPTILDLAAIGTVQWLELLTVMLVVLIAVDLAWVGAAHAARRLLRSPRAMRIANRLSAGIMAGAAAAIAARTST